MTANDLIKKHEGLRLTVYDDATGKSPVKTWKGNLTIGYGLNLESGISRGIADMMLAHEIKSIRETLFRTWRAFENLSDTRKAVVISIAYNCGVNGLFGFSEMIIAIEGNDWDRAADEIIDSDAARTLKKRYHELAELMRAG